MNSVDISNWHPFRIDSLFVLEKGTRLTKADMKEGNINYIGATDSNNGVTAKISNDEAVHKGGVITVAYNGSVGSSFYQEEDFWGTDDVNILTPKFEMSRNTALFICTLLRKVGIKYEFIDKWKLSDMAADVIFLPVCDDGTPNWQFMDDYISKKMEMLNPRLDNLTSYNL